MQTRRWPFGAKIVLALLVTTAAVAWLLPNGLLLSAADTDVVGQFVAWRTFAADSLRAGHLPLWNPYTYAGEPFVGGFQSAVFYPPNLVFLVAPIERAINLSFLWHLVWLGWGMALWARARKLDRVGATVAAWVLPMSGAVLPHLWAGHLSNICTMAWAPWVFLGLDRWTKERRSWGLFVGSAAVAMQLLAGHVQYAFYTGATALIYAGVVMMGADRARRRRALPATVGVYAMGGLLAAVQLLPGVSAAAEGLHRTKLDYSFVSLFSFPPENLVTIIAPAFFGSESREVAEQAYWGRGYLWEMSLFAGVCGLVLGAVAVGSRLNRRRVLLDLLTPALLLLIALGAHTPLLHLLYSWVPGFASFRGLSKFTFPLMMFVALAIGVGADALVRRRLPPRPVSWILVASGVLVVAAGLWLVIAPNHIAPWLATVRASHEGTLPDALVADHGFAVAAGLRAGRALLLGGIVLIVAASSLVLARTHPAWRWCPIVLLPIELLIFAIGNVTTAPISAAMPEAYKAFVARQSGDDRVLNLLQPNNGALLGVSDGSGNDPSVLARYAEFITAAQGGDPARATQELPFHEFTPALAMLRIRFAFVPDASGVQVLENPTPPLPRAFLVANYAVEPDRSALLARVIDRTFNPREEVLLEQSPSPVPMPSSAMGTVRVVAESPDSLELEAETMTAALLIVTDPYSRDWRAHSVIADAPQPAYEVLPADYVLRGIPLAAGHHRLRLDYSPSYFVLGLVISVLAWLAWIAGWVMFRPGRGLP